MPRTSRACSGAISLRSPRAAPRASDGVHIETYGHAPCERQCRSRCAKQNGARTVRLETSALHGAASNGMSQERVEDWKGGISHDR